MPWTDLKIKLYDKDDTLKIGFSSKATGDKLHLRSIWGREKISRLFEVDLVLYSPKDTVSLSAEELTDLLHKPVVVSMSEEEHDAFYGVLQSLEVIEKGKEEVARYFARMVPTVYLLTLTRTNRVFVNKSVNDIIEEVLTAYGFQSGKHFEILGGGSATKRPYVAQYDESDWDFLQRWMEREGLSYWFKHDVTEKVDCLMIGTTKANFPAIAGDKEVSHRGENNLETDAGTIWEWHERRTRGSKRAVIVDYDDQKPAEMIAEKADVYAEGFGTVFLFGDHTGTADPATEATAMVKVRAERLLCEQDVWSGRTTCSRIRAGHVITSALDHVDYLVLSAEHRVGYPMYSPGSGDEAHRHTGRFEAIPAAVQYRPARVTPWPRIHGVIRAHIDTDTSDKAATFAQLDDQGRYLVKMPFDLSDKKGKNASTLVRFAQPYAGSVYGVHHPLHDGTEVLIAHVGGDPDKPVIVAAIPNPLTASPSTSANATQSVTKTASGIRIAMEDQA